MAAEQLADAERGQVPMADVAGAGAEPLRLGDCARLAGPA